MGPEGGDGRAAVRAERAMTDTEKIENRILIAEDDPVSRRMLEAFLKKWGYQVVTAVDGLDAVRILESDQAPALAILDWMMPGLEGPEVCQRIRAYPDRPYVYILLLTARSQRDDLLRGLESGADDYLTKPFDAQELRARLRVGQRILDLQNGLIAAREESSFLAAHDELTGLANRRVVLDEIAKEHSRHLREGGSFAIVLIDLDHFKSINDTRGHPTGDAVLKEVSRRMASCVRPYDTVGRYGGEEFIVVARSCDRTGAMALADRILNSLRSGPIETSQGPLSVTVSCGVAISSSDKPLDPQELIHLADEALYRAKNLGRNRSELATETQLAPSS
jgi:two-component system, cell cycle response regulator